MLDTVRAVTFGLQAHVDMKICVSTANIDLKDLANVKRFDMTKKDYYKKKHADCPCCGWRGCSRYNKRKWLSRNHCKADLQ